MELSLVLLAFGFILSEAKTTDPGIKGRLTLKGLQYAWQKGLEEMLKRMESVPIPDIRGSVSVGIFGNIDYYVTQLTIQDLDLSSSDVSFSPDTGVNVTIHNGVIYVIGSVQIHMSILSTSSWLELMVQDLTINGVLGTTCDDDGHGAVWDAGCFSNAGRINLLFHGGTAWLFNLFRGVIMGPIREALHTQICPQFSNAVTNLEKTLRNFPVSLPVDKVSSFEISLLGPPLITEKSFDLLVKGEFVGNFHYWDLPFSPVKLVLPDVDSRMLLLALSEFTANSAGYVYYKAGALRINVTDDMIPKLSPLRLTVKSLAMFIPELPKHFPDSTPILLQVSARSAPTVRCQPDSLTVQVSADVEGFVTYPNRTRIPIFWIQADSLTAVNVVLSEKALGATIAVKNFSLTLVHSDVGPVKMDSLQKILSFGLNLLTNFLNEKLPKILPLPTPMVRLQDPSVRVLQGYLLIMTDLRVAPFSHAEPPPRSKLRTLLRAADLRRHRGDRL